MNNPASILVLFFLAITFIMSAHEKLFHWNDTMAWMKPHFEKTILKNHVPIATSILVFLDLIAGISCLIGIVEMYVNGGTRFGFYGGVFSCISLLLMLLGQRLAKDFDGARTIAIYFIPAVMVVYWLN
jgi:hypothetical protein